MGKLAFVLSIFLCFSVATMAQSPAIVRPSVSVVGEAEMNVSPDQVVFTFEVITTDKDVTVAKQANDARSSRTLTAAKAFNIGGFVATFAGGFRLHATVINWLKTKAHAKTRKAFFMIYSLRRRAYVIAHN